MRNESKPDFILGVLGLLFAIVAFLVTDADLAVRIAIVSTIFLVLFVILYVRRVISDSPAPAPAPSPCMEDMTKAYEQIRELKPSTIRVYTYVGNFTQTYFSQYADSNSNVKLLMLVRDPDSNWEFPPADGNQNIRKEDAISNIRKLANDATYRGMAHRDPDAELHEWVRFYDHDPLMRVVIAEGKNGRLGFFGFYPVSERTGGVDYAGTGRPVMRLDDSDPMQSELIEDFIVWFYHYWKNLAREPEDDRVEKHSNKVENNV